MKLTIVGSSPAWPNPGGAQSGYLVESLGTLLLDCGAGVLAKLREREPWPSVDAIVITHFHLDHWADLVPWVWGASFGPGRDAPAPDLWLPPGGTVQLDHLGTHFGRDGMFHGAFSVREYAEGRAFAAAGMTVTPHRVLHYDLQTFGLRIDDGERVVAYSGDSGPSDALVELARDADLFLCEATLASGITDENGGRGHLSVEEAMAAFTASGARRLVLTHRPAELTVDGGVELAYDGLELEL